MKANASSEKGSAVAAGRPCWPWVALWGARTPDGEKAMHTPSLGMYNCNQQTHIRHTINDCLSVYLFSFPNMLYISVPQDNSLLCKSFPCDLRSRRLLQSLEVQTLNNIMLNNQDQNRILGQLHTNICSSIKAAHSQPGSQDL